MLKIYLENNKTIDVVDLEEEERYAVMIKKANEGGFRIAIPFGDSVDNIEQVVLNDEEIVYVDNVKQ